MSAVPGRGSGASCGGVRAARLRSFHAARRRFPPLLARLPYLLRRSSISSFFIRLEQNARRRARAPGSSAGPAGRRASTRSRASGSSSCMEETPRSARITSAPRARPSSSRSFREAREVAPDASARRPARRAPPRAPASRAAAFGSSIGVDVEAEEPAAGEDPLQDLRRVAAVPERRVHGERRPASARAPRGPRRRGRARGCPRASCRRRGPFRARRDSARRRAPCTSPRTAAGASARSAGASRPRRRPAVVRHRGRASGLPTASGSVTPSQRPTVGARSYGVGGGVRRAGLHGAPEDERHVDVVLVVRAVHRAAARVVRVHDAPARDHEGVAGALARRSRCARTRAVGVSGHAACARRRGGRPRPPRPRRA